VSPLPPAAGFCRECGAALARSNGRRPPRCLRCGYLAYADPKVATGVLAERDGRLLLVRRNHEPAMGRWSFPSGYVDAGEVVEDAAAREVREETGLDVRLTRLLGVYSTAGEQVIFVAYAGEALPGDAVAGEEAYEVGWFDPDALPELAFPHDPAIVEAWRSGLGIAPLAH
jgi:8-oxo-dGTP diphosphatase